MEDNNEKSKTVEFKPVRDDEPYSEKQPVSRTENDRYSEARRAVSADDEYDDYGDESDEEKGGSKKLVGVAIALGITLVAIIVAGIIIINNGGIGNNPQNKNIPEESIPQIDEEAPEKDNSADETKKEEKNKTVKCSVVFYGDSVVNRGDYYYIKADMYDSKFERTESRKILINSSSVIKENGKRITPDALAYIVEQFSGEMIIFDGEIREDDGFAVSLSFSGSFKEEMKDETENTPQEEEKTDDSTEKETESTPAEKPDDGTSAPTETEDNGDNLLTKSEN